MSVPDKKYLYGRYQDREDVQAAKMDARESLAMKQAHKALDIPQECEEDVKINANKYGLGTWGAVGLALATGLPVAGLAGAMLLKGGSAPETPAPTTKPVAAKAFDAITDESSDGGKTWKQIKREHLNTEK